MSVTALLSIRHIELTSWTAPHTMIEDCRLCAKDIIRCNVETSEKIRSSQTAKQLQIKFGGYVKNEPIIRSGVKKMTAKGLEIAGILFVCG